MGPAPGRVLLDLPAVDEVPDVPRSCPLGLIDRSLAEPLVPELLPLEAPGLELFELPMPDDPLLLEPLELPMPDDEDPEVPEDPMPELATSTPSALAVLSSRRPVTWRLLDF